MPKSAVEALAIIRCHKCRDTFAITQMYSDVHDYYEELPNNPKFMRPTHPITEKEQKFIPEEKKINESLKTKPIDNSFQKTNKKQAVSISGIQRQRQVKMLTDLAMERGVHYAISVAKKMENAYVLDELHDTLVDELYGELKNKGLL